MGVALYHLKRYSDACDALQKSAKLQAKPGTAFFFIEFHGATPDARIFTGHCFVAVNIELRE